MKRQDLYEGIGQIDDDILQRSERNRKMMKKKNYRWLSAVAAVLALVLIVGVLPKPESAPVVTQVQALEQAAYPEMPARPNDADYIGDDGVFDDEAYYQDYEAWWSAKKEQAAAVAVPLENLKKSAVEGFFGRSIPEFLAGTPGENSVYAPLNVYMALSMMAELTDGATRQQILDLMAVPGIEALRDQASALWNGHYRNDGASSTILASSLWLNEDISFVPETLKQLADTYYASSYQGKMGSAELDQALQTWINDQTGGLLQESAGDLHLDPQTVLALATTIFYQARWQNEFFEERNTQAPFHALDGDKTCTFMNRNGSDFYYWAESFGAVGLPLANGDTMWLLLPDEGVTPEQLVQDTETLEFLTAGREWEDQKYMTVNFSMPKFDVSGNQDLCGGLKNLGVTDVFDPAVSDFTPMTEDTDGIFLSQADHSVRVAVDEEGVTAAAYTVMANAGAGRPPEETVDFVLDRPFVFAIMSESDLPLFMGVVHQPA